MTKVVLYWVGAVAALGAALMAISNVSVAYDDWKPATKSWVASQLGGKLEERLKNVEQRAIDGQLQNNDTKRELLRSERFRLEVQLKTDPNLDIQAKAWVEDKIRQINEQLAGVTGAQEDLLRQRGKN